jgi:hypothetical protein
MGVLLVKLTGSPVSFAHFAPLAELVPEITLATA